MTRPRPNAAHSKTNRRTFIKQTGAAMLCTAAAPTILHAQDKSGSKKATVGKGAFKYECLHGWGELPSSLRWATTHGVCVDREGLIYIKQRDLAKDPQDAIFVFDPAGEFVRSFGKMFHGGGHGIDVRAEGSEEYLYLSDVSNRLVAKMNLKGDLVWKMSFPKEADLYKSKNQFSPTNIAFAPDGGFYVADGYGSSYIHQYDKDAKWIRSWGGQGTEPGKMRTPHGLWLDDRPGREPSLVVADRANARLQYFSLDGEHLSFVEGMSFPADIDIQGEVMMVPDLHARITLLDKDNQVIDHLGYDPEWTKQALANGMAMRGKRDQWQNGRFVHPHDACFDQEGNIFVAEWTATGRVTKLRKVS